jgi:two-component system sensor histidine kinase/response regulator
MPQALCFPLAGRLRSLQETVKVESCARQAEAFTQLDRTSTRNFHGTGLGLYLGRRLATLVGGNLYCESQYGKGSVFTLALPVHRT